MTNKIKLLMVGLFISFFTIQAQDWIQIGNDIDGEAAGDWSGFSVSFNSDSSVMAIGAIDNDGNGFNAGHVRVYKNQGGTWTQIGNDIDGEAAEDEFGWSVSLSSDGLVLAIGAHQNNGNGFRAGHVRVYENQSGTWTQIGDDIDGEAAEDGNGRSVSLSSDGTIVAIGAYRNDGNGLNAGHVRVYENQSGTWIQIGSDIDGEAADDESGWSLSLSSDGSVVAIGAIGNDGNGTDSGHVRVYENQNGTWTQIGNDIDGEEEEDANGWGLSLSSDGLVVAIGAIGNDGNGLNAGHVRVYENQEGTWTQIGNDINGEAEGDLFGRSVSLSSDGLVVAIGGYRNDGNGTDAGHVQVYENQEGTWTQIGNDINGEAEEDIFGFEVSLSSDGLIVAIGAIWNDGNGFNSGRIQVYETPSLGIEIFQQKGILVYPNPSISNIFIDSQKDSITKIELYNLLGESLLVVNNHVESIDISNLTSGIYLLRVYTEFGLIVKKIIKN